MGVGTEADTVLRQIAAEIRDQFGTDDKLVTRQTTALDVDGWDSLSHTLFMVRIEKFFSVRFNAGDLFSVKTVGDLVDRVIAIKEAQQKE